MTLAVANGGFPFEVRRNTAGYDPYKAMTEDEMLSKLERARKHAEEGRFQTADAVVFDMRSKYGL